MAHFTTLTLRTSPAAIRRRTLGASARASAGP